MQQARRLLMAALALQLNGSPARAASVVDGGPHDQARVAGRLIVRRGSDVSPRAAASVLATERVRAVAALEALDVAVVEVPEERLARVERRLRASGAFHSVERDYVARIAELPNDPYLAAQWGVTRRFAPEAWGLSTGAGVVVAVVDTGIDATHPDLQGQVASGYDFVNDDADPTDDHGHGTRMAGIVAAVSENAEGVAGVAPQAVLLPVKVLDGDGYGSYSVVASGILYAADHGARVINLSLSGAVKSAVLEDAVDYAVARGALVIAAAGNYGSDLPAYPAAARGAVAVSATTADDAHPGFSNYGGWIDIAAPGVDIVTTSTAHGYASTSGTSPAAAFVSGACALVMAAEPALSGDAVFDRVAGGAIDLGATGWDAYYGWGLVDAYGALVPEHQPPPADAAAPEARVVAPVAGSLLSGTTPVEVTAFDDGAISRVELFVDGVWQGMLTTAPYVFTVDAGALEPGTHRLSAIAYDGVGRAGRSRSVRVLSTTGDGLLVSRAVAGAGRLRLVATVALPDGAAFEPRADAIALTVASPAGMMLAFTVAANSMTSFRGRTFEATVAPSVPAAGAVRLTLKAGAAPGVYAVRVRASRLAAGIAPSADLQVALTMGGATTTQNVAGRIRAADGPAGARTRP